MIYLKLFLYFFEVGLFTFGGGYAMIPLIKDIVLENGWLTELQFYDFIGVCESTPGPIAVNMATYIGSVQGGFLGSLVATLGVVLPSFIIILLIATLLKKLLNNKYFKFTLNGSKPVIVGLILSAGAILLIKCLGYVDLKTFNVNYISMIIFGLITLIYVLVKVIFKKKISAILLIIISAFLGIGVCLIFK